MRAQRLHFAWLVLLALALVGAEEAAKGGEAQVEQSIRPGVNERFVSEDLDVERFVGIFEGESREIAVHRETIADALGLAPGMTVADVGAGTGLFLAAFARRVGEDGRIYAVDISPKFIEHLRDRVRKEELDQVTVVLGKERSVELPEASLDLAFVCDTYHHFEYPRSTLASLHRAIRPGGALVVVDFERVPGESRDWVIEHVRAGKQEFTREIEAAGFELVREVPVKGLEENYMLRFKRR